MPTINVETQELSEVNCQFYSAVVGAPSALKARQERGAAVLHPCGIAVQTSLLTATPSHDRKFSWTRFYDVSFVNAIEMVKTQMKKTLP